MSTEKNTPDFSETSMPTQDYISRVLGYAAAGITLMIGTIVGYFSSNILLVALIALVYPHLLQYFTRSFRTRHPYGTRQILIHGDAILCGIMLALIGFPLELTILFIIMINTSFIVVGSITAWTFCVISLFIGAALGVLGFGFTPAKEIPTEVFIAASLGVGMHLAITAFNSHRQARDLMRLKRKYQGQVERFQQLSHKVSKYISPQIWESIFSGRKEVRLETQRKKLIVFFSDIVGFTALSEQMEAESLTDVLNTYLTEMSKVALKHGGTIDKFIGDSVMVFFGDPKSNGTKRDALACLAMAIDMRRHMQILRKKWIEQGIKVPLQIRMGINTGYCTVGNFGTESRMDYTIIGQEVNLASRLESSAESGEILISEETYNLVKDKIMCRLKGKVEMKGFSQPVATYQVIDFRRDLGANPSFIEHDSEGFSLYLDTQKVKSYDQDRIADALESAAKKIRNKIIA
ncbi:guanylate cyclase [Oleispira antarctica RB-8]|uniref:Guanylate cyclase n=1 Tax=Oleispira antarctica RB-8 TaxID=698738 RepID=R4YNN0_OLEAN|nr:guanylate cyclase [Oleispira antarctica RB-8]